MACNAAVLAGCGPSPIAGSGEAGTMSDGLSVAGTGLAGGEAGFSLGPTDGVDFSGCGGWSLDAGADAGAGGANFGAR